MGVSETTVLPVPLRDELRVLRSEPTQQLRRIREFFANVGTVTWVADTLQRLAQNERALTELGEYAFAHPNGFDWIPLERALPYYRVRLHVWWPDRAGVIEDIHNHAWDFGSRVLCGQLRFTTYRPSAQGEPYYHYPYRFGDDGSFSSTDVDLVHLEPTFDGSLSAGTVYSFRHTELHRVTPDHNDRPVATVIVAGAMQREGSDVYTEKPRHEEGYRLLKSPYGPEGLRARITSLLNYL